MIILFLYWFPPPPSFFYWISHCYRLSPVIVIPLASFSGGLFFKSLSKRGFLTNYDIAPPDKPRQFYSASFLVVIRNNLEIQRYVTYKVYILNINKSQLHGLPYTSGIQASTKNQGMTERTGLYKNV
jgi:hypothetical protein